MTESVSYKIDTEVPASYMEKLLEFIQKQYLLPQKQRFTNFSRESTVGGTFLSYVVLDSQGKPLLQVEVKGTKPIELKLTPIYSQVPATAIEEAKQDLVIAVQMFEEKARKTTLYFAWREGEDIVPEEFKMQEKPLNRLFLETQILFFIVFITVGMLLFYFLDWLTPIVLTAIQFVIVLFSSRIIARSANWHITEKNPYIHLLQYHLPIGQNGQAREIYSREKLKALKEEIYKEVIEKKGETNCEDAGKIFEKYGIQCQPENLVAKKVNVYALVKKIADRFSYPVPKIVISNNILPNAATSGPSPSRGIVLITTGLLVQLEEDEILSVLGHEFAHLKGRDPLVLFALTAGEFLFRFYVLFPLFPDIFFSFLLFVYFWFIMTIIYFIAKFFEARADLVSAIMIGQPEVLAESLEKIGFQRLLYERAPSFRIQEWIGFDPHPPMYFRIKRLEKLKAPVKTKFPLIQSIKDVITGFIASL